MPSLILNDKQKRILLDVVKTTIEAAVNARRLPDFKINDPVLETRCGAFVTIHKNNNLRGCIGNITSNLPLWETVRKMAVEASLHDPRFSPVIPSELKDIEVEISVLSPFEKITDINQVEVGVHGLFIRQGFYQGLLLPQVATEYGWDRTEFIEHTCFKAGLDRNCYKNKNCEIFIFSATVFGEKDS